MYVLRNHSLQISIHSQMEPQNGRLMLPVNIEII